MFKNPKLKDDLALLLKSERMDMVRAFFGNWDNTAELVDKVLLWGHFFWGHYLRNATPRFHRDLIADFFSDKNEYTAAPRGFSKTTIVQLCIAYAVANHLDEFIVVIEKTATEAAEVISGIRDEFIDNKRILAVYGQLVGSDPMKDKYDDIDHRDAQGDVFINGVRIRGKGFNSTVRGLKSRNWRPTRIILDDVEEDEHIDNPDQRIKYEKNYDKGVQPAIDVDGVIKMYGTILHMDSLLKNKIDQHGGKIYKAHAGSDPSTAPLHSFLWLDRWPRESLIKKRQDMVSSGQSTNAYAQEYLNDPVADEERTFKYDWLWELIPDPHDPKKKYRVPTVRTTMEKFKSYTKRTVVNGYAMVDAGDATTESADFTGVIVHFVDPQGNRFRADVRREKRNITDLLDLLFDIWEKWRPFGLLKIGLEKKAFNDQVKPLLKLEQKRRKVYPIFEELKPLGRNKQNRIKGALEGLYQARKIFSVCEESNKYLESVGDTDDLLDELYNFPSAKHDDLSDAEAYGEDIVVMPTEESKNPTPHRDPIDDPFQEQQPMPTYEAPVHNPNSIESDPFE